MKPIWRNPYVIAFVVAAVTLTALRPFLRRIPEAPPVQGMLPAYSLVDENGQAFGSQQLHGSVYVADLIFTTCTTACPMMTAAMHELQKRYDQEKLPIRLVSISVDPEDDTPAKLKIYGSQYGADFSRWSFLTGDAQQIRSLAEQGFMLGMGEKSRTGNLMQIAHAQKFVIVDGNGGLRGFYDADASGIDEIFHRSMHVLYEKYQR